MPKVITRPETGARPDSNPTGPGHRRTTVPNLADQAVAAAKAADVVIYVGGLNHKMGFDRKDGDRKNIELPAGQDKLLAKIVRANPQTVVVLNGGGAVEMDDAWLSRVPALLYAWYGGPGRRQRPGAMSCSVT